MRREIERPILAVAACLAAALLCVAAGGESPPVPTAEQPAGLPGYEGSEGCVSCHTDQSEQWKGSLHARTVHTPTESDRQLLSRSLLCGGSEALWVLGERHARRFLVASEREPGRHHLLPCRWDVAAAEWVNLQDSDDRSLTWERSCGACHTTGFSSNDLTFREMRVGCEACHGPASRHGKGGTRGGMVSFAALTASGEVTICASCHLQGGRSKSTGLNFARNYQAGDDLFADYEFDWASLDGAAEPANPIDAHQKVLIRRATVQGRGELRCTTCHEFHGMGHDKHRTVARQEYCHLCHEKPDFKLRRYSQSCNVCEF